MERSGKTMHDKTQRQAVILDAVSKGGSLEVAALAATLGVTGETIRRDIKALQAKGLVTKVHGAVTLPNTVLNTSFHDRMKHNSEGKRRIAAAIAERVVDGDSLIIETGTTTTYVAQALTARRGLTIITNSLDVARSLAFRSDNAVYMAGGRLTPDDGAALDQSAADFVRRFRVKYSISSVVGVDLDDGLTANTVAEADFSRLVISRAETPIIAIDSSKFDRKGLVQVTETDRIGLIVTDARLSREYRRLFDGIDVAEC